MKNTHSNFKQIFLFYFIDSFPAVHHSVCDCKCYTLLVQGSGPLLRNLLCSVMNFQSVLIHAYKSYTLPETNYYTGPNVQIYVVLVYYLAYHNAGKWSVASADVK